MFWTHGSRHIDRRQVLSSALATMSLPLLNNEVSAVNDPTPFTVAFEQQKLDRLLNRVRDAHWPTVSKGAGWTYGPDADWFRDLVGYWGRGFDWRAQERDINRLPQFTATVRGKRLHFAHLRSTNTAAKPLLMMHGWPYSFYSFSKVAPLLARDFHIVIPSLPGYVFSEAPADGVRGLREISKSMHALMSETLGYSRYFVDGGDHGAVVADWLALDLPEAVLGIHANVVALRHKGAEYANGQAGVADATPEERAFVADEAENFKKENAYFELQRTRPESISYAMTDSPVGLAAYMLDKWQKWSDTRSKSIDDIYGRDRLLTEVMLYALTESLPTAIWPYAGFMLEPFSVPEGRTIDVPYGFYGYPDPLNHPPPRSFAERSRSKILQWEVARKGGHFPMLESPDRYAESVASFAKLVAR
jgi:pimeloyl-ACP methyl ester carboxylesterase